MEQKNHTINIQKLVAEARGRRRPEVTHDRKRLAEKARELRAEGIPVKTVDLYAEYDRQVALVALRKSRQIDGQPSLERRYYRHLKTVCARQIDERGLSTITGYEHEMLEVWNVDAARRLWLCGCSYYYEYSRRFGSRKLSACYLCGHDDGQYFAVRVPSTCDTVAEALEWLTPAAVNKARSAGRWVERQGDVWLVELKAGTDNVGDLPRSHVYDQPTKTVSHAQHGVVEIPAHVRAVRAYVQTQIATGGSRRMAD